MKTYQPEYLARATAPGMSLLLPTAEEIRERRVAFVSLTEDGRKCSSPVVEMLRLVAARVSTAVRERAQELVAMGAITQREGNELAWGVENQAGSQTHCMPGNGLHGQSSYDTDREVVSRAYGAAVGTGPGAGLEEHSATGQTARGLLLSLLSWASHERRFAPDDLPTAQEAAMFSMLTDEERSDLRRVTDRLSRLVAE